MRYDAFSPGGFLLGLRVRRGTKPLPQKAPGEQRSEQRQLGATLMTIVVATHRVRDLPGSDVCMRVGLLLKAFFPRVGGS